MIQNARGQILVATQISGNQIYSNVATYDVGGNRTSSDATNDFLDEI
jgi:hypothetical protein